MSTKTPKDYANLKELLEAQESFPLRFTYKFIGQNSARFQAAIQNLETTYPTLRLEGARESAGGKHLAKTYSYPAINADAVIEIFRAIERMEDLLIML
jgi:putative lipoic acid-binding regulatory protein